MDANVITGIERAEVEKAQALWAQAIVEIGKVFQEKGDYTAKAQSAIDSLYAYDLGPVLFKPTKAAEEPFRDDKEKALSYFVATNGKCAEDQGFAVTPWTAVRFDNHEIICFDDCAQAMGEYYFTDLDGGETKVEYTFGYRRGPSGDLRIYLHHSSVPFSAS